jgi:hypothetical protein
MSTYYPIEFLPNSNLELGDPKNRNYLRNNLPYSENTNVQEDTTTENNTINQKKETYLTSSILNKNDTSEYSRLTNDQNNSLNNTLNNRLNNTSSSIKKRSTKINIDSRLRNIKPTNILDSNLNNLSDNLFFTKNSNILTIYHPNHNYNIEDKIILEYATSTNVKIKKGLFFEKNSNYLKILHTNHNMVNGNTYDIVISNVVGNINSGTFILNIPINMINRKQRVYFTRSNTDNFNPDYYYIQLDIPANAEYTYEYSLNIQYLHIRNIPLNEINANYPISPDRISGYHTIENVLNNNFYQIKLTSFADSSTSNTINFNTTSLQDITGDGGNILIVKIINTFEGYPDNNNYIIDLQKNFYHVSRINLLNTIFPITEKIINATPLYKQNNLFYWQNLSDGNTIYSIAIPTGNYTLPDLQKELTKQIEKVIRPNIDSTKLIDNIYTYNTNKVTIDIDAIKNTFTIQFFQEVILKNAIFKSKLVYDDGFTRIIINFNNHNLVAGNTIILSNVQITENIPEEYLNGTFIIESVIDINTFTIQLNRYNDIIDQTLNSNSGGTAIHLLHPIKSRLLFNYPYTIGKILGFSNVGDSNSITPYNYVLNNYDLYEIDIQENTLGITTQPRVDTRILNVNPNNYILMLVDIPFNDQINLFNTSTFGFAKIMLAGNSENFVYDQFVQLGSTFQEPIATLSNIRFSFYGPDNQLYNFNNIDHSFTIEIIEQLDELNISDIGTG